MLKKIITFISKILGTFGVGYIPGAPGTYGSVVGIFIFYFLFKFTNIYVIFIFTFLLFVVGVFVSGLLNKVWKQDDGRIVIDEVVGQMVVFLFHQNINIFILIAGFILFRFFDITKVLFIKEVEKVRGGMGVMLDDVLAGIFANILLLGGVWLMSIL